MDNYWISANGSVPQGPYSLTQLQSMWREGIITSAHVFWREGFEKWLPISQIESLLKSSGAAKVTRSGSHPTTCAPNIALTAPKVLAQKSDRQLSVYFVLALFFGLVGAHNFYAKRTFYAVIQLGLFILGFWTLVVPAGLLVWVVIEMVTVREDGEGRELA